MTDTTTDNSGPDRPLGLGCNEQLGGCHPERARLAADVARCAGYRADGELREGCEDCRRRTDAPHERQTHMMPPALVVFECHARIAP